MHCRVRVVRTPLNHIIKQVSFPSLSTLLNGLFSYLELALNGPLDQITKDNLYKCHAASKVRCLLPLI